MSFEAKLIKEPSVTTALLSTIPDNTILPFKMVSSTLTAVLGTAKLKNMTQNYYTICNILYYFLFQNYVFRMIL